MIETIPSLRVHVSPAIWPDPPPRGAICLVVDVLRACTTVAHALASEALEVIPVDSVEDAMRLAATFDRETTLLCGERGALPIEGFDLGNSASAMTPEVVAGKTVILSTTNGTRVMAALEGAKACVAASLPTLSACARYAGEFDCVEILCAGSDDGFSREDFFCAGCLASEILGARPGICLDDAAQTAVELAGRYRDRPEELILETVHGRRLADLGFEEDLALACEIDRFSFVPVLRNGRLVGLGQEQISPR
jgi:2-phosphosulfolactate phosphatase